MARKTKAGKGITELAELSVDRVDGVGSPANGLGFLLLKSLSPVIPTGTPEPQTNIQKEIIPMNVTNLAAKQVIEDALAPLKKALKQAEKSGDGDQIANAKRQLTMAKLIIQENIRAKHPEPSRWGPGVTQLFERTGSLPDDMGVRGV